MTSTVPQQRWLGHLKWLFGGAVLALAALGYFSTKASDPKVPLLIGEGGAEWIYRGRPLRLNSRRRWRDQATFRKEFEVSRKPESATIVFRSFRSGGLSLDGRVILEPVGSFEAWKSERRVDLAPFLEPGRHEIRIEVSNEKGPAAALAYCDALGIRTGTDWEASADGRTWVAASLPGTPRRVATFNEMPRTDEAFLAVLPAYAAVFALAAFLLTGWKSLKSRFPRLGGPGESGLSGSARFRWALIWAWCLLAANNFLRTPDTLGFDAPNHLSYIRYVAQNWRIPLASEGWQMFQSPLYYIVSAPLYSLFSCFFEEMTVAKMLRIVPLLSGVAMVELCYRAVRRLVPDRVDLQIAGTAIGGLLPLNLYLAQGLGNEPMAGFLSGAAVVAALPLLEARPWKESRRSLLVVGFLLGLALLTKATAILLLPPLLIFSVAALRASGESARRTLSGTALVVGVVGLVAGWYYLRNWLVFGQPFVGGWDPVRGIVWSQDPGYRTPDDFLRFGEALVYPVYSSTVSFWDGLYSTFWADGYLSSIIDLRARLPWNRNFMISGVLLSLLPCGAMFFGAGAALRAAPGPRRKVLGLAAGSIALYLAVIFNLYLALPVYSTVKATYTVGLLPCYAILAVAGMEVLTRTRILRVAVYSTLACWAFACYASYFVV